MSCLHVCALNRVNVTFEYEFIDFKINNFSELVKGRPGCRAAFNTLMASGYCSHVAAGCSCSVFCIC